MYFRLVADLFYHIVLNQFIDSYLSLFRGLTEKLLCLDYYFFESYIMRMIKNIFAGGLEILSDFRSVLCFRTVTEKRLFWWSLLFFVFVSTCLVSVIQHKVDNHMSYDIFAYFFRYQTPKLIPFMIFRHPFFGYILSPFIFFNYLSNLVFPDMVVAWFMTVFFNVIMSYCVLLVYKILCDIMKVTSVQALLLTIIFISFGHVLILSFTIETFQLSMFLFLMTLYVVGCNVALKQPVNDKFYITLFLLTTGITLTNGVKVGLAYLFTHVSIKRKVRWCLSAAMWLLIFLIPGYLLTEGLMAYFHPNKPFNFISDGVYEVSRWILDTDYSTYLKVIYDHVLCAPLMLHTYYFGDCDAYIDKGYFSPLIDVVVIVFYGLVIWGAISFRRSRFKSIMLSFILFDALLHLVLRFGLYEGQIYCAHWMFLFPLLIASLFRNKKLEKYYPLLYGILIVIGICFFTNNIFRIVQFFQYKSAMCFVE